jgi:hypothetical protein
MEEVQNIPVSASEDVEVGIMEEVVGLATSQIRAPKGKLRGKLDMGMGEKERERERERERNRIALAPLGEGGGGNIPRRVR